MYQQKQLELEAFEKSQFDKVAYLEERIVLLEEQTQAAQEQVKFKEDTIRIANNVALSNRKEIADLTSKITYLTTDNEIKNEEIKNY